MPHLESSWPRQGDKIFQQGADWWNNACLNYMADDTSLIREGYRLAAESLVESATRESGQLDTLIYPIVYLYRHHLELSLKQIIVDGTRLIDRRSVHPFGHSLFALWQMARPILEEIWPQGSKDDLAAVEECILELDALDPSSQTFRYSVTSCGDQPLKSIQRISIPNFSDVIGRIVNFLDCCGTGIGEYLQSQLSAERDYY